MSSTDEYFCRVLISGLIATTPGPVTAWSRLVARVSGQVAFKTTPYGIDVPLSDRLPSSRAISPQVLITYLLILYFILY